MIKKLICFCLLLLPSSYVFAVNAEPESSDKPRYVPLQPAFVVNINDTRGVIRYVQLAVNVMTTDAEVATAVEFHNAPLRHELIMLFSAMTISDVASIERREAIREEALLKVRGVLDKYSNLSQAQTQEALQGVLFTEFVIQ